MSRRRIKTYPSRVGTATASNMPAQCRHNYYNLFDWDDFRFLITEGYRCLLN